MQHPNAANRLDRLPIGRFHKTMLVTLAFAYFFEFADINSFATTAPKLIKLWGLTVNQIAYVTSLSFVGMFIGSLVASWIADRCGPQDGPVRDHALLQLLLVALGVHLGHGLARRLPRADLGRAVGDDRGRGDLPQRDVPGRRARQVPGVRHRDRHLRHPRHEPAGQRDRAAQRLVVATGLRLGRAGGARPVPDPPPGRVAALVREPRRVRARRRRAARHRGAGRRRARTAARARRRGPAGRRRR